MQTSHTVMHLLLIIVILSGNGDVSTTGTPVTQSLSLQLSKTRFTLIGTESHSL